MTMDKSQKRVKKLFDDIGRLATESQTGEGDHGQGELTANEREAGKFETSEGADALYARIRELEAELGRLKQSGVQQPQASAILYEKNKVGYVFDGSSLQSLPDVSEAEQSNQNLVAAPLVSGGRTIGKVAFAPPAQGWSLEEESLASAVAQQVSLQIENLRLLAAAERARVDALAATRQFTHQSWENYLDGIQRSHRIGYAYDQNEVSPFDDILTGQSGIQTSVDVLEQQIGSIFIKEDPSRPFTVEDRILINAVANQISQQAENLRLLADATRARAEAEDATRRLTRQNWEVYAAQYEARDVGFAYDLNDVVPLGDAPLLKNINFAQPLTIRGEAIGQLAVAGGVSISAEDAQLASSVAIQASIHLETLRLNEELQQRARELQELDRLKSAFLANMSHELRTPLNSILGFTDVMLEGLDGPLTEYMDNDLRLVQKNGQHLLHLINDVLDMAKIESGRMNLHPETFKVQDVLEDVNGITSSLASAKNIEILFAEDTDREVEIYADNTRIKQVMINLVNNAIKFTNNGNITLRTSRPDGARVLVTVKDTGLGIPPDHLESIFHEFTQVDTSTTRKVGGTGLGLPISRRLIEMHGGKLWADSSGIEGEGSVFFVELPLEARISEVIEKQEK